MNDEGVMRIVDCGLRQGGNRRVGALLSPTFVNTTLCCGLLVHGSVLFYACVCVTGCEFFVLWF